MLHRFRLSTRILALGVMIILSFLMVFTWLYPRLKGSMYDAKYLKTRHLVESAWGVIDYYAKQAKAGSISQDQAKNRAKEIISALRYEKEDYFWINDMTPRMIMHPIKPELDGQDLSENKDPNGKRLFVAFVETCKKDGAGFVDYYWPKPGEPKPVPKISYVKLVPEWEWIVGSGIYVDDVEKELSRLFRVTFGAAAAIAVVALFLAFLMARSIARPINRIAQGLNEGADQVASASGQVSTASQSLAEGSSEQASSIEETSSSLEEISSMTKRNAENAGQADNLMKEANQVVNKANESMGELTASMQEISNASEETSKIIKTIDEIAFQTNLLALNAAVEAARAGEAGAGFAVVADEVRNLAMRAADAAKNTASLIEGTVKKVKDGSELVTRTNEAFSEVAKSAGKVGELVAEIAGASNEQAQGIDQVNMAVAEMDKVVQQNAANAEESASASEEMNAQAEEMKGMVNELVTLVGGTGKAGGGTQYAVGTRGSALGSGKRAAAAKAVPLPAKGTKGKAPALHKPKPSLLSSREVSPEKVIPMDDKDFQDF